MKRYEDWRSRLNAYIEARANEPFAWGVNDCCIFAAKGIEAMTGVDLCAEYFSTYSRLDEARDVLKKITGLDDYSEAMTALPSAMGLPKLNNHRFAQRGDLVLLPLREHVPALGLVSMDARLVVAPGPQKLEHTPVTQILSAWRVG